MLPTLSKSLAAALVLVLAACGGGGGGGAPAEAGPPAGGVTLSGTLSLPETAAVDADTNDPNQAGRVRNDGLAEAQALVSPVHLIGSVNQPRAGASDGANFSGGDVFDVYQVQLAVGQVVELEFSADVRVNDLDLYAFADGAAGTDAPIGESIGVNAYECLRIDRPGRHHLVVAAVVGASLYTLRIGAPSDGSACANAVSAGGGIVAGEVVARPTAGAAQDAARVRTLGAAGLAGSATAPAGVPQVLRLPPVAAERAAALQRLDAAARGQRVAAAPAPVDLPEALRHVIDTVAYAKQLQRTGLYHYAEPNLRVRLNAAPVGAYPPPDRLYPNQRWHFEMVGLPGAMNTLLPLAPQLTRAPLVAVIDSGIVADHPDLASQIEAQASFTGSGTFTPNADDPSSPGSPTGFHGTHVAGTIAAATFDPTGVAGVAPMARLLPIRVFAKDSATSSSADVAQAILYAAGLPNASGTVPPRRADVINLSLGSARACPAAYSDAVARARAAGAVVVAASGNEGLTVRDSPANCAGVLSVGAVDAQRRKASYANSDPALSLAAPGGDSRQSSTGTGLPDEVYSTLGDFVGTTRTPSYGGLVGTSMAAPHVSGVVALMRYANPALTPDQVDGLLFAGRLTDDLGAAGRDAATGFGLVNATKAVQEALALAGVNAPPVPGLWVAQPSSLDFGAVRTTAELRLEVQGGPNADTVTGVTSDSPAITVAPAAVDAAGRGTYTVTVNRDVLPLGSAFATLTVATSSGRTFTVPVSVVKTAPGAAPTADYGRVYVLLVDPDSGLPVRQVGVDAVGGQYAWSFSSVTAARVQIVAGTDVDNDSLLCQQGEACGGYPQYGTALTVIDLTGDRRGLDFELSPSGGVGANGAARLLRLAR